MDSPDALRPSPRRRSWLRVLLIGLGGVLMAATAAIFLYGLVVFALIAYFVLVGNAFGSNK